MDPFDADAVRNTYDVAAEDYVIAFADDLADLPVDRATLDGAVERVATGSSFLDVGCGSGQVTGYLADRRVHVVGIDLSAQMLRLAPRHPRRTTSVET
jgi:2-polyprenyl-3-methyl-5-hydroxy-6-metoxy-1,4-benzoquinol methylase